MDKYDYMSMVGFDYDRFLDIPIPLYLFGLKIFCNETNVIIDTLIKNDILKFSIGETDKYGKVIDYFFEFGGIKFSLAIIAHNFYFMSQSENIPFVQYTNVVDVIEKYYGKSKRSIEDRKSFNTKMWNDGLVGIHLHYSIGLVTMKGYLPYK